MIVTGTVQGIGYRHGMVVAANGLGVTGWVRNRDDGSVEAVVQGNAEQLAAIINWARHGPAGANIEHVTVTPADGSFTDFAQLPTG